MCRLGQVWDRAGEDTSLVRQTLERKMQKLLAFAALKLAVGMRNLLMIHEKLL